MPKNTVKKLNKFLLFKLPSAFFTGVRLVELSDDKAISKVKFRWRNQNPFKSIYFAVLAMAAELTTGVLVMQEIEKSKKSVAMLVVTQTGNFHKKAVGKITFTCESEGIIADAITKSTATGEGQIFQLASIGKNEQGEIVSSFTFDWSLKVRS